MSFCTPAVFTLIAIAGMIFLSVRRGEIPSIDLIFPNINMSLCSFQEVRFIELRTTTGLPLQSTDITTERGQQRKHARFYHW